MSLKNKTMVGLAALALAGGAAMTAMPAANAATPKCGNWCSTLASQKFGATDVMAIGAGSSGELAAFRASTNEDFHAQPEGRVNDFYRAGVIAKALYKTYRSDLMFQYVYAPDGKATSNLCLAATPGSTSVTLLPCGASADTLWVALSGLEHGNFIPLMSAALSTESAMLLTATTATGSLTVTQMNLSTTTSDGVTTSTVSPYQMWEIVRGAYGSSTTEG